ncbi:membrane protein [Kitasatospora sp. NE20-6]|uniref:hypothetical protein n=1 Tax=Kitasatospora sp. NE20-6 TaxID=2859066 RepID=UPI0034DBD1EC
MTTRLGSERTPRREVAPRPVGTPQPGRRPAAALAQAVRRAAPALLGYLLVRALGVAAVVLWHGQHGTTGLHRLATMWDAYWYQDIAVHGYAGSVPVAGPFGAYEAYAFFPVYPALVRATWWLLPLPVHYAALLVAWAGALLAAWGIFAVADRLHGRRAATVAVLLWGAGPYAVVQSMAYSELLFTAFAAWAMYAAVTRRWIWAGTLSSLAGLTRPTGVAVAGAVSLAALWALITHLRHARRDTARAGTADGWWRPLAGGALAPLGFVAFIAWVGTRKGRWDGYFRVQDAWQSHFDLGRSTLHVLRRMVTVPGPIWLTDVVVAGTLVVSVVLFVVCVVQRQALPVVLFSAMMLILAIGDAAYFNSRARFLMPAFGLLLPVAVGLARVRTRGAVPAVIAAAAVCSAVYGGYVVFVYPNSP